MIAESLNCMLYPNLIVMANLYGRVATYDFYNNIDTVDGLVNDKVFIFHGTEDSVVNPGQLKVKINFRIIMWTNFLIKRLRR